MSPGFGKKELLHKELHKEREYVVSNGLNFKGNNNDYDIDSSNPT